MSIPIIQHACGLVVTEEINLPFENPDSKQDLASATNPVNSTSSEARAAYDLLKISELCRARLASIAKVDPRACQASYLFRADYFCGVRYATGPFTATWLLDDSQIQFCRNGNPIGIVEVEPERKQAA